MQCVVCAPTLVCSLQPHVVCALLLVHCTLPISVRVHTTQYMFHTIHYPLVWEYKLHSTCLTPYVHYTPVCSIHSAACSVCSHSSVQCAMPTILGIYSHKQFLVVSSSLPLARRTFLPPWCTSELHTRTDHWRRRRQHQSGEQLLYWLEYTASHCAQVVVGPYV